MIKEMRKTLSPLKFWIRDMGLYARHIVKGTSYAEYYADRMDRHIRHRRNWGLLIDRTFQVNYLKEKGLKPEMSLLDYGCGAVAAGRHMIEFLAPGGYCGADVSAEAIAEGTKRIESAGLDSKLPQLIQIPGGNLEHLPKQKFDFIWSYSVLTHMPPNDINSLLSNIRSFMHGGTRFFADFARADGTKISHKRFKDWYYPVEAVLELAAKNGLDCKMQSEWRSPEDPAQRDTMVCFSLLS